MAGRPRKSFALAVAYGTAVSLSGLLCSSCNRAGPGRPERIRPLVTLPGIADVVAESSGLPGQAIVDRISAEVGGISAASLRDAGSGLYVLLEDHLVYLFGLPEVDPPGPGPTSGMVPSVVACTTGNAGRAEMSVYYIALDMGIGCVTRSCRIPPVPGCKLVREEDGQEYILFTPIAVRRARTYYPALAEGIFEANTKFPCTKPGDGP